MSRWTCPFCDREFSRAHQSHVCVPGGTVDDTFAPYPAEWRLIYDAVVAHLDTLGPVHADAVKVGVFLKTDRKLAEIRPRARAVDLMLMLPGAFDDPRVARVLRASADLTANVFKLTSTADVDDQLRVWLTAAYATATRVRP